MDEVAAIEDILKIILQIRTSTKQVFKALRKELLKSRAEVYRMKAGAGVALTKNEEVELDEKVEEEE